MLKTEVISAPLRTKPHSAPSANSQPKPNNGDQEIIKRFPVGYYPLHPNVSLNFQMNRFWGWANEKQMLEELRAAGTRIKSYDDWTREMFDLSDKALQTWLWGEMFPNDMDWLVAIASTPAAISGRNMIWREMIIQAIRSDPAWKNGDYPKDSPPKNWIKAAIPLSSIMTGSAEQLQKQAPTRETAIDLVDKLEASGEAYDANDFLYAFESSADYDPAPKLSEITKPMLTINFANDLTNPPEHLHLPTASNYVEVMIPAGSAAYGHMTLAHPAVWASALGSFLERFPHEG